ncbi:hypothetical protein SXCC_01861 [Gluconacetobacter sp. SXCC-1]|nr:hypothetical protein SXCC_01861 [Gluconacetobacter sp. SXCC-1]
MHWFWEFETFFHMGPNNIFLLHIMRMFTNIRLISANIKINS